MKNKKLLALTSLFVLLSSCSVVDNKGNKEENKEEEKVFSNTAQGIADFLNYAGKKDNYTITYYYGDEAYHNYYDSRYVYNDYIEGGYVVIDNFFEDQGGLFSCSLDEENDSITISTIYALTQNNEVTYPDSTLTINSLKYYLFGGYVKDPIDRSLFFKENGQWISTDKTFNYYMAALGGYQSYVEDGSSPAISYLYEDGKLTFNMMAYEEDGVTLSNARGADFTLSDVTTTKFEPIENYLTYSANDFASQPSLTKGNCPDLLSEKWSLNVKREIVDSQNKVTSTRAKVQYDYNNEDDGKKGVCWKQFDNNDNLVYTLFYQVNNSGNLYSSSLNPMNELVPETYAQQVTVFNTFQDFYNPTLWKKIDNNTYQYFGLDTLSMLYSLTMWNFDSQLAESFICKTETVDGKEVIKGFEAIVTTTSFTVGGTEVDEVREKLTVDIVSPRDIDTSLTERRPTIDGVTDRLQTAIDKINDKTKAYTVRGKQVEVKTGDVYDDFEETFSPDYYLKKQKKNGKETYRGFKMVDGKALYFYVDKNSKVHATSALTTYDTALSHYKSWDCVAEVYDQDSTNANLFTPNGNVKNIPDNMPLYAADTPSNIKVYLHGKDEGKLANLLDKIEYRVSTFGGYLVDDYTLEYDFGDDGNGVSMDSSIAAQVTALEPAKEEDLPSSWTSDPSGIDSILLSQGYTEAQIAALPYFYSPATCANWKAMDLGGVNIYSDCETNLSSAVRKQFQSDIVKQLKSDKYKELGWTQGTASEGVPLFNNEKLKMSILIYSEADYGITVMNSTTNITTE